MTNFVVPYIGTGVSFRGLALPPDQGDGNFRITTRWFVIMRLAVVPLSSWLVQDFGGNAHSWNPVFHHIRIVRRLPLYWPQVLRQWLLTLAIVVAVYLAYRWWVADEPADVNRTPITGS